MGYLKEFLTQINNRDHHKFLVLWEEYCTSDQVDVEELNQLLKAIRSSDSAKHFGQIVETALPLWKLIDEEEASYEIFRQLIDLQTTNSPALGELTFSILKKYHGEDPRYQDKLRLAGLRNKEQFQGAISRYDLVSHFEKGNMVFHSGGWGAGEIMEVSLVREHLIIEFEHVSGRKDLSFANAFKTLVPLSASHFLARRFADADRLEQEGKEDAAKLIRLLLKDLGPKTAAEIKDELADLVIPEQDWNKWWQGARAKIKKDPLIETPESLKEPFILRKSELSSREKLHGSLGETKNSAELIQATYNFVRDHQDVVKEEEVKKEIESQLLTALKREKPKEEHALQIFFLLEQLAGGEIRRQQALELVRDTKQIVELVEKIEIVAFKKRALLLVKEQRTDWIDVFLELLFKLPQTQLRDYIFRELEQCGGKSSLDAKLKQLLAHPDSAPDMFIWYFQKLLAAEDSELDPELLKQRGDFFEAFFVLMHSLESQSVHKDLLKKMYTLLSGQRYALMRRLLQGTTLKYTEELLLLASKCQTFSIQDMKILRSLAEVVHPSLAPAKHKKGAAFDEEVIWTTEQGYLKTQQKVQHIGTIEVVENSREIEEARKHGDLRENSEFKFAQEKRARLQSELKDLSDQLRRARVISPEDVHRDQVGIGAIVEIVDPENRKSRFSILGRWDADTENNIISYDSKFAQAMMGKKKGEQFEFKSQIFKIATISSFLEQE